MKYSKYIFVALIASLVFAINGSAEESPSTEDTNLDDGAAQEAIYRAEGPKGDEVWTTEKLEKKRGQVQEDIDRTDYDDDF